MNLAPAASPDCLDDERIAELVEGLLADGELERAQRHLADCPLCRSVVGAAACGSVPAHPPPPSSRLPPVAPDAYEVGREIARGGMGRILEAWDCRHERRVAIKVRLAKGAAAARRFAREIRVTARLQHPAIVPLYDAGVWPDGEPFFVMRLVRGRPLDEVIAATSRLEERLALLPHVVALTGALAYAHQQDVVHRDIKPSNVLCGAFGETVVIDWGLAKELHGEETDDETPGTWVDAVLTGAGRQVGTPSYMAPEQARGEAVDPRTDVYALGAVLYHLFAGAPPYAGASPEAVLARVLAGAPPSIRSRAPGLPPEFCAIVDKAMAQAPSERYPTAAAMAEDLERFADGRMVSAHRYSLAMRTRRWVAQHRAAVATVLALVLGAGATGAWSLRRIVRERDRADALAALAEQGRARAIEQRNAADALVGFMVGSLKDSLSKVGRLDAMSGVGGEVERYYDRVLPSAEGMAVDVATRRASALEALAQVDEQRQDMPAALSLYASANELRAEAVDRDPGDLASIGHMANNLARMAAIDAEGGDQATRAVSRAREAADLAARLMTRAPEDGAWKMVAARARIALGGALWESGNGAAAGEAYREGLALALAGANTAPDDLDRQLDVGRAHFFVAYDAIRRNDASVAIRELRAAAAVQTAVAARDPGDVRAKRELGWSLMQLGRSEAGEGDVLGGLEDAKRAESVLAALSSRDPENEDWRRDVTASELMLCESALAARRLSEASVACRAANAASRERLDKNPRSALARTDLSNGLGTLASVELLRGDFRAAREAATEEVIQSERAIAADADDHAAWDTAVEGNATLAQVALREGHPQEAIERARLAVTGSEDRGRRFPDLPNERELDHARLVLGQIEAASGARTASRATLEAACPGLARLSADEPGDAELARWKLACTRELARLGP